MRDSVKILIDIGSGADTFIGWLPTSAQTDLHVRERESRDSVLLVRDRKRIELASGSSRYSTVRAIREGEEDAPVIVAT